MRYYFMPDQVIKSVYELDLHALKAGGFRFILFDLDNTLVPWNNEIVDDKLKNWIRVVKNLGFQCIILSNNAERRIKPVAEKLGLPYRHNAVKPMKRSALRAMEAIGAKPRQTVLVGDQLITDIWAGKRAKLYTVLVSPINVIEHGGTKLNRFFENIILNNMGVKRP